MANPFTVQPLGGLQNVQMIGQGMQGIAQNVQADREEERQRALTEQAMQVFESNDPRAMARFSIKNPEFAERLQGAFGFSNEQTKPIVMNTYQQALANPERAVEIMQQGIQQVTEAGGRPVNMTRDLQLLQQDPETGLRNIEMGFAAASPDTYDRFFGGQPEPTAFMQEMQAAGIEPGSDQFKSAVLERYGKGKTIGYDVVEAVNPDTGRNEYFQVSRTDPGDRVPLGLEVPQDPRLRAKIEEERQEEVEAAEKERDTVRGTMDTIDKILKSDGLSGFSGLDSFRRFIPGTEAANVAAYIEQLQSQNFLTAVEQMKGMGALSENEGKKLSSAVAALSPSMSDEAIKRELNTIRQQLAGALEKINSGQLQGNQGESDQTVNWSDL